MGESMDVKMARIEEQMKVQSREIEKLAAEVSELVAAMNRGRGAFGFAMVLAGAMGAAAVKVIGVVLTRM